MITVFKVLNDMELAEIWKNTQRISEQKERKILQRFTVDLLQTRSDDWTGHKDNGSKQCLRLVLAFRSR